MELESEDPLWPRGYSLGSYAQNESVGLPKSSCYMVRNKTDIRGQLWNSDLPQSGWKESLNTRNMPRHEKSLTFHNKDALRSMGYSRLTLSNPEDKLKWSKERLSLEFESSLVKQFATDLSWQRVKPILHNVKIIRKCWTA